jgi:ABC-type multidrug transport system fused ATPase/permease subunit
MEVKYIVSTFKGGLVFITSLVVIEKLAWIIEPSVFGKVIDAMIDAASKNFEIRKEHLLSLFVWIFVFTVNSASGALRRMFDVRLYLGMFARLAGDVARSARKSGEAVTKTAARVELSKELVTFFQHRIPDVIEEFFDLGGTVIALAFYDWRLSATCFCITIPLIFINRVYAKRVGALERELHDGMENVYDVFTEKSPQQIHAYYSHRAGIETRIARWGATNFGILRGILLCIFLAVLYISIDIDDFSTGKIYSIVSYVWTFVTSTEYLPDLMESWASLKDITTRLRIEKVGENGEAGGGDDA